MTTKNVWSLQMGEYKEVKENKEMKKGVKVIVECLVSGTKNEIFISKARIKRYDDRPFSVKVTALELARQDFCRKNNLDIQKVNMFHKFKAVEYNL